MFAGEKALANLDRPRRPGSSHAPQDPAAYGHVDEVGTAAQRVADTVAPLSARPRVLCVLPAAVLQITADERARATGAESRLLRDCRRDAARHARWVDQGDGGAWRRRRDGSVRGKVLRAPNAQAPRRRPKPPRAVVCCPRGGAGGARAYGHEETLSIGGDRGAGWCPWTRSSPSAPASEVTRARARARASPLRRWRVACQALAWPSCSPVRR